MVVARGYVLYVGNKGKEVITMDEIEESKERAAATILDVKQYHIQHKEEIAELLDGTHDVMSTIFASIIQDEPALIMGMDAIAHTLKFTLIYGYRKGREYIEIPEVYKR